MPAPTAGSANEQIARVRDEFGDRLRYVFRHRPLTGSEIARRAAELVEHTDDPKRFWDAHIELMTRSETLTEDDLRVVANDLGLAREDPDEAAEAARRARARVEADEQSARASGVMITPTFFINGRRYDGPWDESSLADAMLGRLGHRVRSAALDFASWGPSAGVLLLLATLLAVALTNSPLGPAFAALWEEEFGFAFGAAGFSMSLQHWVNDGLLTIFFLVVGLEIKREFTVGHLATWRAAALPVAAAIGGMVAPALLYLAVIPHGPWSHGWGVPMATDTAFAVALIVMLGERVPVALRIFLTAAAIVDDIGAIVRGRGVLFRRSAARLSRSRRRDHCGPGAAQLVARVPRGAVHAARHRALGLRARERPARDAGRRGAGAVHPDPTAAESARADDAGGSDPGRRSAPWRARCCATGRRCRRCAPSMRSTTGWNRRPTVCCATPARARATWCCRCSRWPMPASP